MGLIAIQTKIPNKFIELLTVRTSCYFDSGDGSISLKKFILVWKESSLFLLIVKPLLLDMTPKRPW